MLGMSTQVLFKEPEAVTEPATAQEDRVPYAKSQGQAPSPFPENVTHEWVLVTPDAARQFLETMHDNRSKSKLEKGVLAANLREGNWFAEISPVYFDDSAPPRAWDGQHRFEAVIEADLPAVMLFITGVSERAAEYIDTGRRRTRADWYKMQHLPDYTRRAVVSRMLALYGKYGVEGVRSPAGLVLTPAEQDAWVDVPGMTEAVKAGNVLGAATGANPGYAAYEIFRTAGRDADGAVTQIDPDGFWESVRGGAGLLENDPALTLRNFLVRSNKAGRIPADARLMELYVTGTAWNKHVLGQPWSKPSPRFETTSKGKKVFPASQVPDLLPLDARKRHIGALRNAYSQVKGAPA
jgi:hypothetical protein